MYALRADLEAIIPPHFIVQALDDDGDGQEDAGLFDKVSDAADRAVNAYLSGRFSTPFAAPYPDLVAEAAKVFIAESLYARRGYESERNPYTARANALRKQLESIGNGNGSLGGIPDQSSGTRPPMAIVSEPSRTTPAQKING